MALDRQFMERGEKKNIHICHTQNRSASSIRYVDRREWKTGEFKYALNSILTSIKYRFFYLLWAQIQIDLIVSLRLPLCDLVDLKEYDRCGAIASPQSLNTATTARTRSFGLRLTPTEEEEASLMRNKKVSLPHPQTPKYRHTTDVKLGGFLLYVLIPL